jgi:NAD(P)H-dependent FMN reductase
MNILVILGSARVNRQDEKVAKWVALELSKREGVTVDYVDAAALNLPFYNESSDPLSLQDNYAEPKGLEWAKRVAAADGVIFVTAEYNHGYTALMKNTIDWVGQEWAYKPASFVSYSTGMTGGVRAVEQLKPVTVHLSMIPLSKTLPIAKVQDAFNESGEPVEEIKTKVLGHVLDELIMMVGRLKTTQ